MIRLFKHYIPHAVVLLGLIDIALLFFAADFGWRLRASHIGIDAGTIASRFWQLTGFTGIIMLAMIAVGV